MSNNLLKIKDPPEDVSSTTLKQWQRSVIRTKIIVELDWQGTPTGRTWEVWDPQLNHPTCRGVKAFIDRVDRAQEKGLEAVLELQQELKLEDANGKKN